MPHKAEGENNYVISGGETVALDSFSALSIEFDIVMSGSTLQIQKNYKTLNTPQVPAIQ